MKKVVNGKTYNTGTAEFITEYRSKYSSTDSRFELEKIYRTKKGDWFVHFEGGAHSTCADYYGNGNRYAVGIKPMTEEDVKKWLREAGKYDVIEKHFPVKLLHRLKEILSQLYLVYDGPAGFPIDKLKKPIVSYREEKDTLLVHINITRDCFEPKYLERLECQGYCFDPFPEENYTHYIPIKSNEDREMANYVLTLNELPSSHWTFFEGKSFVLFEGFGRFNIPLEKGLNAYKNSWENDPINKGLLRKRKIESARRQD